MLYLVWLLINQVRADAAVLFAPALDPETLLALMAPGYILLLIASYWRKPAPRAQRADWIAVITMIIAVDAFGFISRQPVTHPESTTPALILMIMGTLIAAGSALVLGRSFSLLPQARTLVQHGPYAYIRHPMYAGGLLISLGEVWLRWSPIAAILCVVTLIAQIARLRMEERLLSQEIPDYLTYRSRTSALIPGIY